MSIFDQKVRVASEDLARTLDRREFLKGLGSTVFAGIAALAAGHIIGNQAEARKIPLVPNCVPPPPNPHYCNLNGNTQDPNGCHGSSCFQDRINGTVYQCRVYYQYYTAGCWTTPTGGGYWTCCDCECRDAGNQWVGVCGCAQYSTSPVPRPDAPGARG